MVTLVNLEVEQGTDFTFSFKFEDPSTNLPVDLTGYSAWMGVVEDAGDNPATLQFSSGNGTLVVGTTDGTVTLIMSKDTTAGLGQFMGSYSLLITAPITNIITKIAKGFFVVLE